MATLYKNSEDIALCAAKNKFMAAMKVVEPKNLIRSNPIPIMATALVLGIAYKTSGRKLFSLLSPGALLLSTILRK